ncbi:MAG: hypothetical protein J7K13_02735, partial [Thermoplasmata archaeon]|nr:hypothetical protein [Thermoplasmata archaeon]
SLYQTKYNPKNYRKYIDLIDKSTENEINYKLKTNPFDPERCSEEEEKMYFQLLKRINDSYMGH